MKNKVQNGNILSFTAPAGGVISGMCYLIGIIFGVAAISAAEGMPFEMDRTGVYTLPKKQGEAWSEGEALYWDDANKVLTTTAGTGGHVAAATEAAASTAGAGNALILPVSA